MTAQWVAVVSWGETYLTLRKPTETEARSWATELIIVLRQGDLSTDGANAALYRLYEEPAS